MAESKVSDELWDEFHLLVNMTSRELEDWLRTNASSETTEALPEDAGEELGAQVVRILGKRRADLTDDDISTMERVTIRVRRERGEDLDPVAGDAHWRHKLMSVGHDPLKPTGAKTF
ncbi:DUF3140 domain-containing protein [Kribbella lupini]|uniref:DUF3140 domain-containing protein n=1 Tax=Kribbella lupini TaxID=291602 RepID=A0ABN2B1H9_9ACTN